MKVCEACRYPSGEHARDCPLNNAAVLGPESHDHLNQVVDEMMADALGLQGEERVAVLHMIEESRAAARPTE